VEPVIPAGQGRARCRRIPKAHLVDAVGGTGIKYFSGTATYKTTFKIDSLPENCFRLWLDLGM